MIILGVSWREYKTNFVILPRKTSENVKKALKISVFSAPDSAFCRL